VEKVYAIRRARGALTSSGFSQVVTVLLVNGYQIGLVDDPSPTGEKSRADYADLAVTEPPMFWEGQAVSTECDCALVARLDQARPLSTFNTIISYENSEE
jgi:hypothetical protein